MNAVDLVKLESLTKDYAAFQARKSGLATALGALMAILTMPLILMHHVLVAHFGIKLVLGAVLFTYLAPLVWLVLKQLNEAAPRRGTIMRAARFVKSRPVPNSRG